MKRFRFKNNMLHDTTNITHNKKLLSTILNNIKIDTLWTRSVSAFGAQTINLPISNYDFIILFYRDYTANTSTGTKILYPGIDAYLDDTFFVNNKYYTGRRGVYCRSDSIKFDNAYNEIGGVDNAWYMPFKILGIKISGGGTN